MAAPGPWDVVGTAPAQVQNPWAVKSVAPAPVEKQSTADTVAENVLGPSEILGGTIANIPHAAAHAAVDLYQRIAGKQGEPNAADTLPVWGGGPVPLGKAGQNLERDIGSMLPQRYEGPQQPDDTAVPEVSATTSDIANQMAGVAGDVGNLVAAGTVGKALAGIPGEIAANTAARIAATPAAVTKYGMRTAENNPIARNVAGTSAQPAVTAHNQAIADPVLGAQAGVPPGTKLTPASLEAGRTLPDSVYQRGAASIPTGLLSPNAAQMVQGVGADDMIVHSPDTQATIEAQKARLLSTPMTGDQLVNTQRALRFNGFKGIGSDDPEQQAVGRAQLRFADALHQHMVDTLPPNAPVSADQLVAARVALAQNHTVENALGPNGNVNLTKLAKLHNDNPGMLTGPMRDIAQFASDHPEVTRLPSDAERFNPSGVAQDVLNANVINRPVGATAQFFGGALARRALTGGATPPVTTPVTGLGGEFGELPMNTLAPPSGALGEAPSRQQPLPLAPGQGQTPGITMQPPLMQAFEPHQPQLAMDHTQAVSNLGQGRGSGGLLSLIDDLFGPATTNPPAKKPK